MPCRTVVIPGGGIAIVCSRGSTANHRRCVVCKLPGNQCDMKLCDYPLHGEKAGQTCDRPICRDHALHVEPDTDFCPAHARLIQDRQQVMF